MNTIGSNQSTSAEYNPLFIIGQMPDRFGSKQDEYLSRTREIIQKTAERISQARSNKENLQSLFFELIAELSARRAQLAKDHQTKEAEDFGLRRENKPGMISFVPMGSAPYTKYGDKILEYFSSFIKKMELSNGQFQKEMTIKDKCNGRASTLTFKIHTNQDKADLGS